MSSPVHQDKNLDAELRYAPPWVRDQARDRPRPRLMPTETLNLDLPPPRQLDDTARAHRDGPYAVDVAVLQMKRQLSLNPEIVPQPPRVYPPDRRPDLVLRIGVVVVLASLVALAMTMTSVFETKRAPAETVMAGLATPQIAAPQIAVSPLKDDRLAAVGVLPRLVTEDRRAVPNEPLPAGIRPDGDPVDASVALSSFAPETRLAAGTATGEDPWRGPPGDLGNSATAANIVALPPPPTASSEERAPELAPDEMATLVKRGEESLRDGDLAAARLLLRRAATAGSAGAAFALGASYDPRVIQELGAIGAIPDAAQARAWYQKALALGSPAASLRLEQLAQTAQ